MNSVLEYLRQLNQQSVTLRDEWLDRLRHVECEPGVLNLSPEICLTKRTELRSNDSSTYSAPTVVIPPDRIDRGHPKKADNIPPQAGIKARTGAPTSASGDTEEQTYCAPDHPKVPSIAEFREAGATGIDKIESVFPMQQERELESNEPGDDQPDFIASHTIVPLKHTSKPESQAGTSPEMETPGEEKCDDVQPELRPAEPGLQIEQGEESSSIVAATEEGTHLPDSFVTLLKSETSTDDGCSDFHDTNDSAAESLFDTKAVGELAPTLPRSIDKIADQLLARFPIVSPATVMFASLNPGIDVDDIAADIATCLANRDLGKVLLIDGNSGSRELSNLMEASRSPGLTELVNGREMLFDVIGSTDNRNLSFLPHGIDDVTHRRFDATRAMELEKELKKAFQYAIVSGGMIEDSVIRRWCGFVDAVYLLIDLGSADRQKTMDSLTALRHQAVRIAGIITVVQ